MPNRSLEAAALIKSLPKRPATKTCNARTPTGYCRLPSGFDTDHLGEGRCKFHGGRAGRDIIHGMYSKSLTSTIKKEFEKLVENPMLVDLHAELAVVKSLVSSFLRTMGKEIEDRNFWIQKTKIGDVVSAKSTSLIRMLDSMTKIYSRIVEAENKSQENLKPRDVFIVVNQLKVVMNNRCAGCPIREFVANDLGKIKMPAAVSDSTDAKIIEETETKIT